MKSLEFTRRYKKLDSLQKKAVDTIEGPLLVIAGPGSGKTEILSLRVANILLKTDTSPSNILCLTFTDSAAATMRQRLLNLISSDAYRVSIFTFHAFCTDVIERFPEYFYGGANFHSADPITQLEVLEGVFKTLSYDDPLSKTHPEQGYIYLKDTHSAISNLKKAGLTPKEFFSVIKNNEKEIEFFNKELISIFSERTHRSQFPLLRKFLKRVEKYKAPSSPLPHIHSLSFYFTDSLAKVLDEAEENSSTKPLTVWKEKWLAKDEHGIIVLKDSTLLLKLYSLASVYEQYMEKMYALGYYDFDDMLLEVIEALSSNETLRYELQEKFQYILVDEFQDTNDAQMRLLNLIVSHPVNEGRPNLMAVGDDDQAIYKFQGAQIDNILRFKEEYRDAQIITLTSNYRSTQDIIDLALHVIQKGENRLERRLPNVHKALVSAGGDKGKGEILYCGFVSAREEYEYIAHEIKKLLKEGLSPSSIAVIARKHEYLENIVPYLYQKKITVNYERQQNVLRDSRIQEIIVIARFLISLGRKDKVEADEFLPEILSFPFWEIPRKTVWEISLEASKSRRSWLSIMLASKDKKITQIAHFLIDLSVRSLSEPIEYIIDSIVGAHVSLIEESEDEIKKSSSHKKIQSPFKEYYFGKEEFNLKPAKYLLFLSSLRVFVYALREYKHGSLLKIDDLVTFVNTHEKNELILADENTLLTGKEAVTLLTAHKAKGLEFDTVFVLHCQNEVWSGKGFPRKISFPANLPITPAGDTNDDHLRLFFVALTRAKRLLFLSSHAVGERGKIMSKLSFLTAENDVHTNKKVEEVLQAKLDEHPSEKGGNVTSIENVLSTALPFIKDEKALLKPILEDYTMSVTHLNNFLNVVRGGPQTFLEQNLLRFPQAKTASAAFGSAMHKALELLYRTLRRKDALPTFKDVSLFFTEALRDERLSQHDFTLQKERGIKSLKAFYASKKKTFRADDLVEVNFKNQGVVILSVPLSGKIDKMVKEKNGEISVYDWKTGEAHTSWNDSGLYDKIQLHQYARQLMFYKLLVEHSRDFREYKVFRGVLEFLEPYKNKIVDLQLTLTEEGLSRTRELISVVYKKILNLDFPSVEKYEKNLSGIIAFENDLLSGKI